MNFTYTYIYCVKQQQFLTFSNYGHQEKKLPSRLSLKSPKYANYAKLCK